jgi:hypothetical protein
LPASGTIRGLPVALVADSCEAAVIMKNPFVGRRSVEGPLRCAFRKKRAVESAGGVAPTAALPRRFQLHSLPLRIRKGTA